MKYSIIAVVAVSAVAFVVILASRMAKHNLLDGPGMVNGYVQISQEVARAMMERDDGHIVVDVRRQDEYDAGHIPGAVLIPNESIGTEKPAELPDLDQIILVYCRSGRRSREAARKLFDMGYTNVYEFGGIIDWTGDIVKGKNIERIRPTCVLVIEANGKVLYAHLADNASAKALIQKLNSDAIALNMRDHGRFEKAASLPWELPRSDTQLTAEPGDIVLYEGNQIAIYYGESTRSFTKLASIGNTTKDKLLAVFGDGDVAVRFSLEWGE